MYVCMYETLWDTKLIVEIEFGGEGPAGGRRSVDGHELVDGDPKQIIKHNTTLICMYVCMYMRLFNRIET